MKSRKHELIFEDKDSFTLEITAFIGYVEYHYSFFSYRESSEYGCIIFNSVHFYN